MQIIIQNIKFNLELINFRMCNEFDFLPTQKQGCGFIHLTHLTNYLILVMPDVITYRIMVDLSS